MKLSVYFPGVQLDAGIANDDPDPPLSYKTNANLDLKQIMAFTKSHLTVNHILFC